MSQGKYQLLHVTACMCIVNQTIEPEMWQLNKIVVPQIMAHWEDVAYNSLHYSIPTVEAIEAKHKSDPKKCCQELLKGWLSTKNEAGSKTWEVLLKQLKEVPELTASVEHIMKQLVP